MKRAIVSVINDLATDRRVDKTCCALQKSGFRVVLVGRKKHDSLPLERRSYITYRMRLFFGKGPCFYAEYNIRLFFYLLFHKADLLFSNDLDTLLPNFITYKIKRCGLIFDSHEYFTETPEVVHRKFVKNTWKRIEKTILPKLRDIITVNQSIAGLFENEYGIKVHVVRNIPPGINIKKTKSRKEIGLPEKKNVIILQGSGINIQRGAEELVESIKYVDKAVLLIIGGGDVFPVLKDIAYKNQVADKIIFHDKVPFEELYHYTSNADLGITIDKNTNINYWFSLPNKLFDYIHAGTPVLASRLPEIQKIMERYEIGTFINNHDPKHIGKTINQIFDNPSLLRKWKENTKFAASELNWESEEKRLNKIIEKYV